MMKKITTILTIAVLMSTAFVTSASAHGKKSDLRTPDVAPTTLPQYQFPRGSDDDLTSDQQAALQAANKAFKASVATARGTYNTTTRDARKTIRSESVDLEDAVQAIRDNDDLTRAEQRTAIRSAWNDFQTKTESAWDTIKAAQKVYKTAVEDAQDIRADALTAAGISSDDHGDRGGRHHEDNGHHRHGGHGRR